jgi:hypothetical protein
VATFLVTDRMNAALRARVERSVSPRARARHASKTAGVRGSFARRDGAAGRYIAMGAVALVAVLITSMRWLESRAVEARRSGLFATLATHRQGLPPNHGTFVEKTAQWVRAIASEPADADVVSPEIGSPEALGAWLSRPGVYIRGAAPELADASRLNDAATTSIKDAFLLCLLSPPPSSDELDVLAKVNGVYFGGAKVDRQTENVRRLLDARVGLEVLHESFEDQVRGATSLDALKKLERSIAGSTIASAKKAAVSELLIVVVDEVDGVSDVKATGRDVDPLSYRAQEGTHHARVALVDLASDSVLLRVRRRVDASELSKRATMHRVAAQGCRLALEARRTAEE